MGIVATSVLRCLPLGRPSRLVLIAILAGGTSVRALVIVPTFDSTITSDPNAATIENTINTAIQFYEARLADPITVTVEFQEITTSGLFGHSSWWYYNIPYSQYRASLKQDATTTNDTLALASLPSGATNPVTGSSFTNVKTANLRAIGITGDNSGLTGGYDGIIGLHTSELNLSRASTDPSKGDLLATVEHELDEVLGLGSSLDEGFTDPFPEDLFRYTATGSRTFTISGDNAYFSLDGTDLLARFNQTSGMDYGDWWVAGTHVPQVQDASATDGAAPNPKTELVALDVIGYNLLPVPQPVITRLNIASSPLTLSGSNGLASATYIVLTSTNLALPASQWSSVATNFLGTNGAFTFAIPSLGNPGETERFFALRLQL